MPRIDEPVPRPASWDARAAKSPTLIASWPRNLAIDELVNELATRSTLPQLLD